MAKKCKFKTGDPLWDEFVRAYTKGGAPLGASLSSEPGERAEVSEREATNQPSSLVLTVAEKPNQIS